MSERTNIDHGQLVGRTLDAITVIMDLDELGPFGGRTTGGRDGRRFEGFADVKMDLSWERAMLSALGVAWLTALGSVRQVAHI